MRSANTVLTISELRAVAARQGVVEFERQLGPFALVQRPPRAVLALAAQRIGPGQTLQAERAPKSARTIDLVLAFDQLVIATLPPVRAVDELLVGRLPDCDLVVENPSVSKRHAVFRWDGEQRVATVMDLGSSNGTRIDERVISGLTPLNDCDVVSFGDVDYWFMLTPTLHQKLLPKPPPQRPVAAHERPSG